MNKNGYNIKISNEKQGVILNETFMDPIQFKLFLKMVHGCVELQNNLSFFDGETFFINIPYKVLKKCVITTQVKEISMAEQVKTKIEALVTK